ncbi:MAG TPA: galactokinase [Candidatus Acidoferrum sp.]|nr:galactokinase [Candidatus Acidoferrum sp.]
MSGEKSLAEKFRAKFGGKPHVYRAPGRVNLIGEHTDYNDGFVMPAAIGFYCWVAAGPRNDQKLVISSEGFPGQIEVELGKESQLPSRTWSDYAVGVAAQLEKDGFGLSGANLLIHGEVPIGAGLSSSASIEVATAIALAEESGISIDRTRLARICQRAENEFVGMRCGIMDQFISLYGRAKHALMLDCRSLQFEVVPIPETVRLVICNTGMKHKLASGEYNRRREECEEAVRSLGKPLPGIRALRDVSRGQLEEHRAVLSEVVYKRALHVVAENNRVLKGMEALREGDLYKFGEYMAESHMSLRDLFEVSCAELDLMVDLANGEPGVYGARMTGGGFGGATINLVDAGCAEGFAEHVAKAYQKKTGIACATYICVPVDGASRVESAEEAR